MKPKQCPKCGKWTSENNIRRYTKENTTAYIHESKVVARPFPHVLVTESCHVRDEEPLFISE